MTLCKKLSREKQKAAVILYKKLLRKHNGIAKIARHELERLTGVKKSSLYNYIHKHDPRMVKMYINPRR